MKIRISTIILIIAGLLFLSLAGRYGFTIVSIEEAEQTELSEEFDPVAYVNSIWDTEMIPTFNEKAVDLSKILSEIEPEENGTAAKDDLVAIANKYGLITVGEAHVYLVKGSGRIVDVDNETSLGTAEVQLAGYEGPITTLFYVSTRIPSDETSVRDAVGFISFGDFKEQTEYGKAASEINKHVLTTVLEGVERDNLIGKTVNFKGAFTIRTFNLVQIDVNEIRIVPVEFVLGE